MVTERLIVSEGDVKLQQQEMINSLVEHHGEDIEALKKRYINSVGQHEALDRTFVMSNNFSDNLLSHPYIALDEKIFGIACDIERLFFELYQAVAEEEYVEPKNFLIL